MGLSGEQKRTARKNASAARTTTGKTARKATRTASASAATPGRASKNALKKRGAKKAATSSAPRTAAARKAAPKAARKTTKPAASKVAARPSRNGTSNGATNGLNGTAVDYLNPTSIERRKSRINGWGVFALEDIPKNKRIVYYAGERISAKESGPREEKYLEDGCIWCFQLNRNWVIDAAIGGNIARFVNHACKPNCYTHIVDGVIWIRAGKNIRKGQELTYNYYTEGQAEIPCKCSPGCQGML